MQSVTVTNFESEEGIYSYVCGNKHRMREQEGVMLNSSILDYQIECSCNDAKDFACVADRGKVEEEEHG